jgi:uncharacterized protein
MTMAAIPMCPGQDDMRVMRGAGCPGSEVSSNKGMQAREDGSAVSFKSSKFLHYVPYGDGVIIFSKFHGSVSLVDSRVAHCLKYSAFDGLDIDAVSALYTAGFIVYSHIDEFTEAKTLYDSNRLNTGVLFVTVEVTQNCNLKCLYCYQNAYRTSGYLADNSFDDLVYYVRTVVCSGERTIHTVNLNIIGGEPLLYKAIVRNIVGRFRSLADKLGVNLLCSMDTNGVFLDDSTVELFDVLHVALTNKTDHDKMRIQKNNKATYDRILRNLSDCREKINSLSRFSVRFNANNENYNKLYQLYDDLGECGLKNYDIDIFNTIRYSYNADHRKMAKHTFKQFYIEYLRFLFDNDMMIRVFPKPNFTPCKAYIPYNIKLSFNGQLALCDAFTATVGEITDLSIDYKAFGQTFEKYMAFTPYNDAQCNTCTDVGICGGKYFCKNDSSADDLSYCDYLPYYLDEYLAFFVEHFSKKPQLFTISDRVA